MRKLFKSAAAGVALALALAAPGIAQDTLTIGIMVPTTGSEATYGQDMANAVNLAIEEINAKGGVLGKQLASTVGDDACDAQQAVNAASKLASSGVVGIVGGYCSGATVPTLKIYGDAKLPMIIPAANSTKLIPANPGNAFMINSTGNDQVAKAIEYFTTHGIKSLAIVNQGDSYSQDLADLTKSGNPDAVFWTAYYADGGLLIRQLREAGYQGLIAVGDGSNSPELFKIAGPAAEGVIGFSNPTAEFLPEAKAFAEAYTAKFGSAPGPYSTLSYDATKLLAWAFETAGSTDFDKVVATLASANFTDTISGPISFTPEKTLARSNFVVLAGKGGAWTLAE